MKVIVSNVIIFIIVFLFVYIIYNIVVIKKEKKRLTQKRHKKYDEAMYPVEVMYLIKQYKLDLKKVNYISLLRQISLICSFDLSLIACLATQIRGTLWQVVVAAILCFPTIYISFQIYGKFLQKKGLTHKCTTQKR